MPASRRKDPKNGVLRGARRQHKAVYVERSARRLGTLLAQAASDNELIIRENPHLDHGYAVTSHSSQGQTADRVLIHVDTAQAGEKFLNRRLAYVAISRGRYDAQIYTNDKTQLAEGLGRDVSHRSAIEPRTDVISSVPKEPPEREWDRERERERTQSYSIDR